MFLRKSSKFKLKTGKYDNIIYNDFTVKLTFNKIPDKKIKRELIKILKKDKYFKKVKVKSDIDNIIILSTKYGNSVFFPSSTSSVRDSIIDHADNYQFNLSIKSKYGSYNTSYEWKEKKYCVYYTIKQISNKVAYVYADSAEEAKEKLYNGDYDDDGWIEDLDCEIIRINDTERY